MPLDREAYVPRLLHVCMPALVVGELRILSVLSLKNDF